MNRNAQIKKSKVRTRVANFLHFICFSFSISTVEIALPFQLPLKLSVTDGNNMQAALLGPSGSIHPPEPAGLMAAERPWTDERAAGVRKEVKSAPCGCRWRRREKLHECCLHTPAASVWVKKAQQAVRDEEVSAVVRTSPPRR